MRFRNAWSLQVTRFKKLHSACKIGIFRSAPAVTLHRRRGMRMRICKLSPKRFLMTRENLNVIGNFEGCLNNPQKLNNFQIHHFRAPFLPFAKCKICNCAPSFFTLRTYRHDAPTERGGDDWGDDRENELKREVRPPEAE